MILLVMNENTGDIYIMKAKKLKRGLALMLGVMMAANLPASVATPFTMLNSYAYTCLLYTSDAADE